MHHIKLWNDSTYRYCLQTNEEDSIYILECTYDRILNKRKEMYQNLLIQFQKSEEKIEVLQAILD